MYFPLFALPGDVWAGMGQLYILPDEASQETATPADSLLLTSFLPDTVWVSKHVPDVHFVMAEDSLRMMARQIVHPAEDSLRMLNNDRFATYMKEVIGRTGGMQYAFDSLATVSLLMSPDSSFRIITWYVPLSGQRFRYFGLVQLADVSAGRDDQPAKAPSHERQNILDLREVTDFQGEEAMEEFSYNRWYGSWYYGLITEHYEGRAFYTLLGWRADQPNTRKRIIEPFALREGKPVFGAPVFDLAGPPTSAVLVTGSRRGPGHPREVMQPEPISSVEQPYRIVLAYSVRVSTGLLYDAQPIRPGQQAVPMIVFDRLEPMDEAFRGQREHYVPEGNIFDAFLFQEGRWVLVRDVDARKKE